MKRKPDEPPKGAAPWMNTFSDLMNLLLCFFVLLFSMSTVNEEKFQQVIASLQSSMSILPSGSTSIGEGEMISAGVRQLEFLDTYYNDIANSESEEDEKGGVNDILEAYQQEALGESEEMAEKIEDALQQTGMQDVVDVDFNEEYVSLSLSGAILFQSGKAEVVTEAEPIIDKLSYIIQDFDNNLIEVEGHTDNVPMSSTKVYEDNDVLSMYRALNVANMLRNKTDLNPANIKSSGRGEYAPIADNSTAEGRAKNRRVEIKIYNSYNSNVQ